MEVRPPASGSRPTACVFTRVFTQSPIGPLQPTGKPIQWEAINTFRYDREGRVAEEWVQSDHRTMLIKLGVEPA